MGESACEKFLIGLCQCSMIKYKSCLHRTVIHILYCLFLPVISFKCLCTNKCICLEYVCNYNIHMYSLYVFLKNICNVLWSPSTFKALKQRFLLEIIKFWNLENMDFITTWKFLETYFLVPLFLCNILLTRVCCSYILIKDLTLIFILQIPEDKRRVVLFSQVCNSGNNGLLHID